MTTHIVNLRTARGGTEPAAIEIWRENSVKMRLSAPSLSALEVQAGDVFEALCFMRERLEPMEMSLLCKGAAENVYPSRMSRASGNGETAYEMTMGKPARAGDQVQLFAPAEREAVATVASQRAFYQRWLKSLGQPATPAPASLSAALVKEAKNHPNGWVYEIDGPFRGDEAVPPEAIKGAWKVDGSGNIVGDFIPNEKFKPKILRDLLSTKVEPGKPPQGT